MQLLGFIWMIYYVIKFNSEKYQKQNEDFEDGLAVGVATDKDFYEAFK